MISCCLQYMNFAQEQRKHTQFSSNTISCVDSPLRTSRFRLQPVKKKKIIFCCHYKTICRSRSVSDTSLFIITLSCLIQLHIKAAVGTAFWSNECASNLRFCQNPLLIHHCTWHTKQDRTGTLHKPVQRRPCSKAFPCMLGHCGSFA